MSTVSPISLRPRPYSAQAPPTSASSLPDPALHNAHTLPHPTSNRTATAIIYCEGQFGDIAVGADQLAVGKPQQRRHQYIQQHNQTGNRSGKQQYQLAGTLTRLILMGEKIHDVFRMESRGCQQSGSLENQSVITLIFSTYST